MSQNEEYWGSFQGEAPRNELVISKAVEYAITTRNFEIELYWKRAAYFWTFIAAAFAGYFALLSSSNFQNRDFPAFVVSCIGIFLNLSWFLVNKGSKFWQENWESHVSILSLHVSGPIFTKVMTSPKKRSLTGIITNAAPISVSKVNQWVSTFMFFVWFVLMLRVAPLGEIIRKYRVTEFLVAHRFLGTFIATLIFAILMCVLSKTNFKTHECEVKNLRTRITN